MDKPSYPHFPGESVIETDKHASPQISAAQPSIPIGNTITTVQQSQPNMPSNQIPGVMTVQQSQPFMSSNQMPGGQSSKQMVCIFGRSPVVCYCPNCSKNVLTTTETQMTDCGVCWTICLCCCITPLVFIPFVSDDCKETKHLCPYCGFRLGSTED